MGRGSNCYQVTQCNVGVSLHSKTHPLFICSAVLAGTCAYFYVHVHVYMFSVLFLQSQIITCTFTNRCHARQYISLLMRANMLEAVLSEHHWLVWLHCDTCTHVYTCTCTCVQSTYDYSLTLLLCAQLVIC